MICKMDKEEIQILSENIKDSLQILVQETVYEQTKHKDKEVSGLHRQILQEMKGVGDKVEAMKVTLDQHDVVIKELMDIYKTSGHIKKVIIWIILFVPSVAAFIAGLHYLKQFIYHS